MAIPRAGFLLIAAIIVILTSSTISATKCYPTPFQMCRELSNKSVTPNLLGNRTAAVNGFGKWLVLMRHKCSPDLIRFICQVHFPPCLTIPPIAYPPCREMCQKVRRDCDHWIRQFNFQWPQELDCNRFTKYSVDPDICAWPRPKSTTAVPTTSTTTSTARPYSTTTTPRPRQRWTSTTWTYPSTTTSPAEEFNCPAWQLSKARSQLMKIIDVSGWRYPCKMQMIERLQQESGSRSLSIDGRLRRIDRLLRSMTAQMRTLTANNKYLRAMNSIRRLLRNL